MPRLLVIDDRDQTIEMCHRHLPQYDYVTRCDRAIPCQVCEERDRGCKLKCAHNHAEAAETLGRPGALPDLVVLDLHFALPEAQLLPEDKAALPPEGPRRKAALDDLRRRQGLLILERLRATYPALPVVMLTTTGTELLANGSQDPFVYFCQNEVVDSRSLSAEIARVLATHHQTQEGRLYWGRSRAMAELRHTLTVLARSPLPLLLEGETGTGKSYLAEHFIHPRSGARGPLVVTDLSTLPSTLLPAHLFGARRGAYTGATEDHPGVFEQAHGGTLFLDEIANLDLDLQRQLLLVLERGVVTRLGDSRSRPAAPKLIAATNQDLGALVQAGKFRGDLYMRLNPSTQLRMPALRERADDIPDLIEFALLEALRSEALRPLVRAYLARFPTPQDFDESANRLVLGRPTARDAADNAFTIFLGRGAMTQLTQHAWPGNLRELRLFAVNALVFALTRNMDDEAPPRAVREPVRAPAILTLADQVVERLLGPTAVKRVSTSGARGSRQVEVQLAAGASFAQVSADVERQYLRALFASCEGDLARMAQVLLGPQGTARQMHLRLNQVGLRLRTLRETANPRTPS